MFQRSAGADQHIDRGEFANLFGQMHPEALQWPNYYQLIESVFSQIDANRSGKINFGEFVTGYQRLRAGR